MNPRTPNCGPWQHNLLPHCEWAAKVTVREGSRGVRFASFTSDLRFAVGGLAKTTRRRMSCLSPGSSACCSWLFATRIAAPGCSEVAGRPHSTQRSTVSNTTFHHHAPRYRLDLSDGTSGPVPGLCLQFLRPVFPGFASCDGSGNSNNADARAVVHGFVPAMLAKEWCDADGSVPRMLHAQGRARLCPCPSARPDAHARADIHGLCPPCLRMIGAMLAAPCRTCATRKS